MAKAPNRALSPARQLKPHYRRVFRPPCKHSSPLGSTPWIPGHKLVIQHVAVVGEPATEAQVAALGHAEAASALQHLADAGLLRQGHDGRYDAVDPMLREVAYETLPRHVRGELHRRAAKTATTAVERARHLDRAANYLADDETAVAEAADALAEAGVALIAASRVLDGLRLLEQAVAQGHQAH